MSAVDQLYAFVSYPDALYTEILIKTALASLSPAIAIHNKLPVDQDSKRILQWCTYDEMSHEITLGYPQTVLSSCYAIRKSLIRKHFLHRAIQEYTAKHPDSPLNKSIPLTWDLDITHSDELDEMWVDDLYDLAQMLPDESDAQGVEDAKWFILKPGMADRGMGIRLFRSKEGLQHIFNSFEGSEDEDEESGNENEGTNVMTGQLRYFVIQEYLSRPMLIDPRQALDPSLPANQLKGRKFHLRAYCVAQGALKVYLATRILALFSSSPYQAPSADQEASSDLSAHLTNTALQESCGEENVRLLQELVGCNIFSLNSKGNETRVLTQKDVDSVLENVATCLAEVFQAGLNSAVHFQTLPNAFELFGADLLLTWSGEGEPGFQISLLELNAEPAVHLTGPRLDWILKELFTEIADICVAPFYPQLHVERAHEQGKETKSCLRKCLDVQVRGSGGW